MKEFGQVTAFRAYRRNVLLAEELALVAIDSKKGRHELGSRGQLNACLAGLVVAELLLEGVARPGDHDDQITLTRAQPSSPRRWRQRSTLSPTSWPVTRIGAGS